LKQVALAVANYEASLRVYPPSRIIFKEPVSNRTTVNGMLTLILPYIEQSNLSDLYDYTKGFDHADNQVAVNASIAVYQCPSTPGDRTMPIYNRFAKGAETPSGFTTQATDYMHPRVVMNYDGTSVGSGALADQTISSGSPKPKKPRDITDGLSNTLLMIESAGHPINYILKTKNAAPPTYFGWYGEWPDTVGMFVVPYSSDGTKPTFIHPSAGGGGTPGGTCIMNCNNNQSPYSFHPGGINVCLCDGSVRFLAETLDAETFWNLCSCADGNVLGEF